MTQPLSKDGTLTDIRVVELVDEQAEYVGRLLAGLGADVIKVEPPTGNATRSIGPFFGDVEDPEKSLYFWHYNLGKRSVVLDLESTDGRDQFLELLATADVFVESMPHGYLDKLGLSSAALLKRFPSLIVARMSPFGDDGPWAGYKACDLVHLALGGPMMNSGYDPEPDGSYDTPPIAPQLWHSYHIAGAQLVIVLLGALLHRRDTGEGQYLSCAVHDAVATNTELDTMQWIYLRQPLLRQTSRHAAASVSPIPLIGSTKDGRWMMAMTPGRGTKTWERLMGFLDSVGMPDEFGDAPFVSSAPSVSSDAYAAHTAEVTQRVFKKYSFKRVPWQQAQEAGLMWVPLRKPHENVLDEHWWKREVFADVLHEDLGRSFTYATSRWLSTETEWRTGPRAPHVGEHTGEVMADLAVRRPQPGAIRAVSDTRRSRLGKPFALHGVRILDFSWYLASGGAPRFLAAMGASNIKVEWKDNPDTRAFTSPVGGRAARERATAPLKGVADPDMSGHYNNKRPGQRAISLNVRHPKGLEIAKRLVAMSDIVVEGFSPGVMERWGLGYDELRRIRPDIIYAQQSGMGAHGLYGQYRTVGPVAGSLAGISEMSGLPEPHAPAGWGYSYLDWEGAFNLAMAMLAGLNYRSRTGKGQWIDSSQTDPGIFLTGVAVLDWSANGREWRRFGNRSPYKPAAPHGAYRCEGVDRWIAIGCFTESDWYALTEVASHPEWRADPRFSSLRARLANQDALDALMNEWTVTQERFALMDRLQRAGVAAGVCQDAEDKCEQDPQLRSQAWLTEVTGRKIGTWPVVEVPVKASRTPPFAGGELDRAAPIYAEDNEYVYGELLGMSSAEIGRLVDEGVI